MRQIPALARFNHGLVSPLGLARTDQARIAFAAETMTNWIARVLGSMALRPGLKYIGASLSNAAARYLPFVFATTDNALMEFTAGEMRVWINDVLLSRVSVNTTITNGTFAGNITGWTDGSDSGGAATYLATNQLKLASNGTARAIAYQAVTVAGADQGKEHGLRIVINHGPVTLRVGSTLGADDYITETTLDTGTFSLALTPTGNFYIQFQSTAIYRVMVGSCTIESSGVVTIPTPFMAADLGYVRAEQSGDTVYLACSGYQQRKVERRGTRPGARGWGISIYQSGDGPFNVQNLGVTTIATDGLTGNVTLTASVPLFRSSDVGALFSITSAGQTQTANLSAENTFTGSIVVTGIGDSRTIGRFVSGTWVGTISLQRSTDNVVWSTIGTYTSNFSTSYLDGLDNQTIYYRMGFETGNYTSGTATILINFPSGTQRGIVRVTGYTSSTSASAEVLAALGSTTATKNWQKSLWGNSWPTAVRIHEGRLWWSGQGYIFGSVSDQYTSYDSTVTGDSGPIIRTIGIGPVDTINWLLGLQRLVIGAQGAEISARSSSLDSPLTPTDFSLRACSTKGSGAVEPIKMDQQGVYVDRTGVKVFELDFDVKNWLFPDYSSTDLTAIVPELGLPGIVRMAVQMKPDQRIHCVRSDGLVMLLTFDKVENVTCWQLIETDGVIEDVVVLPAAVNSTEDQVYYSVARTINGSTVRYLEKWALETECRGGTLNKQADAFILYSQSGSSTISGLSHLVGKSVVVWDSGACLTDANGDIATFTVQSDGTISVSNGGASYMATQGVVGLSYTAQWKSAKLAIQPSPVMTMLNQQKRMSHIGFVAAWIHAKGLKYGSDFDNLQDLPGIEAGAPVDPNAVRTEYDEQEFEFPVEWLTDLRLCLQAQAPRPCTMLGAIVDMEIHD